MANSRADKRQEMQAGPWTFGWIAACFIQGNYAPGHAGQNAGRHPLKEVISHCLKKVTERSHPQVLPARDHAYGTWQPIQSFAWNDRLRRSGVRISVEGCGRCMDNIFIERLLRSLKHEVVYLEEIAAGIQRSGTNSRPFDRRRRRSLRISIM